jgi:hypothetical protein
MMAAREAPTMLDMLRTAATSQWSALALNTAYYGWLVVPVVVGLVIVSVAVLVVLPRQRRRDDLSGRDRSSSR